MVWVEVPQLLGQEGRAYVSLSCPCPSLHTTAGSLQHVSSTAAERDLVTSSSGWDQLVIQYRLCAI